MSPRPTPRHVGQPTEEGNVPDRRKHGAVVDELLHALQQHLTLRPVELRRLLPEEPVEVGMTPVDPRPARDHSALEAGRCGPEGGGEDVDGILRLLVRQSSEKCRALEWAQLSSNSDRVEVGGQCFGKGCGLGVTEQRAT